MNRKWLLSGMVAMGLIAAPAVMPRAFARDDQGHVGRDADVEREVKYEDLPPAVKDVLDHERRDHRVNKVMFVRHNGQEFYRATVEQPNVEREIRITPDGKLLTEGDAGPRDPRGPRDAGPTVARHEVLEGVPLKFDDLPGDVKGAIGKEAGPARIDPDARKYVRGDKVWWQVWVTNGDRTRVIQCDWKGNILLDADVTPAGVKEVNYDRLPGEVKHAIDHEAGSGKVLKVTQTTSEHRGSVFTAEILEGSDAIRYVTVSEKGDVLSELSPHVEHGAGHPHEEHEGRR